jgi:hypothetical protein
MLTLNGLEHLQRAGFRGQAHRRETGSPTSMLGRSRSTPRPDTTRKPTSKRSGKGAIALSSATAPHLAAIDPVGGVQLAGHSVRVDVFFLRVMDAHERLD